MKSLDLIHSLSEMTEASVFDPLHQIVRLAYRKPIRVLIEELLTRNLDEKGLKVFVRHSVESGTDFNLFRSDLDCSVVLSRRFSLQETDRIREKYVELKKILPMLGEIEIFSKSEWTLLSDVLSDRGELIQQLRDLKKIRWMEWKLKSETHPYHTVKARKAILRVLKKYEPRLAGFQVDAVGVEGNHRMLGEGLSKRLRSLVPFAKVLSEVGELDRHEFQFFSREIDATIGSTRDRKSTLNLPFEDALILLSLYPSHEDDDPKVLQLLNRLRATPTLRPMSRAPG